MQSLASLLLFAPLSYALPNPQYQPAVTPVFGDTSAVLRAEVKSKWYADPTAQSTSNYANQLPANPGEYKCVGPTLDKFPSFEEWLSFEQLWDLNNNQDPSIPTWTVNGAVNTQYAGYVKSAIQSVSKKSGVDARIILSIILEECHGKLDVECTDGDGSKSDCGMMQIRGGAKFDASKPQKSITQMVTDGVYGVPASRTQATTNKNGTPGLLTLLNAVPGSLWGLPTDGYWCGNPYTTAKIYNTGNINGTNLNEQDPEDEMWFRVYPSDFANRLLGWNGGIAGVQQSRSCPGFESRTDY
ncbi:hypothetical protein EJ04DRAFT_582060 [Polyplosphaeria fusca]|uniref:Transglycosylase SLT domain-containing protein n=1 Tax=Polyplosphaeria fusca TaxID=682080 RepID=A0A9P4QMD3_9PLEO|nr:hypothetical protein EJ04DRAFT_582060 [Polyplosphaeria fusca]